MAFEVLGRPDIAKELIAGLLASGVDVAYSYKPLHHPGLAHAFTNTVLYLDYHRNGFPYPVIPFPVNAYGRKVVSYRGFRARMDDIRPLDPPSPPPWRMMEIGAATARVLRDSPWRVALIASSSWSHAFITDSTHRLFPAHEADRTMYDHLRKADWDAWRRIPLDVVETAGQQELLNWWALMGAMEELDLRPSWTELIETWIFNSNKVFAAFESG